ncbi:MAG: HD domain-containing protein [Clostridia bacterium]|nr:HD domain-containing protein [Clostridia bacterium]
MPINDCSRKKVLSLARKYRYERKHALKVEKIAFLIFDALKHSYNLTCDDKLLLSHACLLHDIGYYIGGRKHNKHSKYLIEMDESMDFYPEKNRHLLSLIAYNHRKKEHMDTYLLPDGDKELVLKLSAILRVADALDYTREDTKIKNAAVNDSTLRLKASKACPDKLLDRLNQKKKLFLELFGIDIIILSQ